MRILISTDAWTPQVNGVVRTLETTSRELQKLGHEVRFVTPEGFRTVPMPTYPEIKLALFAKRAVGRVVDQFKPDRIHISTEGPLGLAMRRCCLQRNLPFTTSFHTRFPEYIHARFGLPPGLSYSALRWFHGPASAVMVATRTLEQDLKKKGFRNLRLWSRGVDIERFSIGPKEWLELPRPVFLYVGRVAIEKSVEDFLKLDLPGSKLVVGDGPQLRELRARYPVARFVGGLGRRLARHGAHRCVARRCAPAGTTRCAALGRAVAAFEQAVRQRLHAAAVFVARAGRTRSTARRHQPRVVRPGRAALVRRARHRHCRAGARQRFGPVAQRAHHAASAGRVAARVADRAECR